MPEPIQSTQPISQAQEVSGAATQQQPATQVNQPNPTQASVSAQPATTTPQAAQKPQEEPFTVDYGDFGVSKEVGLEGDIANMLKDFGIKHKVSNEDMRAFVKGYLDFAQSKYQKSQADFENIKKGWEQANTDKYKTEVDNVYNKINNFLDSKESGKALKSFLQENDISKHNAVVDFLYEISKDYTEDNSIRPSATGDVKEKDAYSVLYPNDAD